MFAQATAFVIELWCSLDLEISLRDFNPSPWELLAAAPLSHSDKATSHLLQRRPFLSSNFYHGSSGIFHQADEYRSEDDHLFSLRNYLCRYEYSATSSLCREHLVTMRPKWIPTTFLLGAYTVGSGAYHIINRRMNPPALPNVDVQVEKLEASPKA